MVLGTVFLNKCFIKVQRDSKLCFLGKTTYKCWLDLVCWLTMFTLNGSLILSGNLLPPCKLLKREVWIVPIPTKKFMYFSAYHHFLSHELLLFCILLKDSCRINTFLLPNALFITDNFCFLKDQYTYTCNGQTTWENCFCTSV